MRRWQFQNRKIPHSNNSSIGSNGSCSEKNQKSVILIDNPNQIDLGELLRDTRPAAVEVATEAISYQRRKKQRDPGCVTDQGLRFDDTVPVEVIEMPAPELSRPDADQYEVIDYKVTRRLGAAPGQLCRTGIPSSGGQTPGPVRH